MFDNIVHTVEFFDRGIQRLSHQVANQLNNRAKEGISSKGRNSNGEESPASEMRIAFTALQCYSEIDGNS